MVTVANWGHAAGCFVVVSKPEQRSAATQAFIRRVEMSGIGEEPEKNETGG